MAQEGGTHDWCTHRVPVIQAYGASVTIWGCFSWSGLVLATSCVQKKIRSADCPNVLNDQVFPSVDLFSTVMAQTYSKMTEPRFIWLKLWKSGSGRMSHHFHTWFGHNRVQTLTPLRIFGTRWRKVQLSHCECKMLSKNLLWLWREVFG